VRQASRQAWEASEKTKRFFNFFHSFFLGYSHTRKIETLFFLYCSLIFYGCLHRKYGIQLFNQDNCGFGGCNTMAVLGFQNQNMPATDDANEFDKFDVKKIDPTKDTGITVDNL
jgi:hypothetical protein